MRDRAMVTCYPGAREAARAAGAGATLGAGGAAETGAGAGSERWSMGASPDECDSAEVKAGIADGRNAAGAATVGAQYTRHSDAAHGKNAERVLTCILYLNEGWDQARDGGCLRVWPQSKANPKP